MFQVQLTMLTGTAYPSRAHDFTTGFSGFLVVFLWLNR